jgi:hypothetical protein
MMQLREIQKWLLREVGARIEEYGFNKRAIGQSFFKSTEWGKLAFHLSFIRHREDLDITADVGIRVNAVEDLINTQETHLKESEKKDTFTFGAELGNIAEGVPHRWTIRSDADVSLVAVSVVREFVGIALPYFEKYCQLHNMLSVLMSFDRASSMHSPIPAYKCMRAVALARMIVRNEEEVLKLAKECEEVLRKIDSSQDLSRYLKFTASVFGTR